MTLKDDAERVAVLGALLDLVKGEYETARSGVRDGLKTTLREFGGRSVDVELPDGTVVATITLARPKPGIDVDAAAFLEWVKAEYPGEVVTAVRESFRRSIIGRLDIADGIVVDTKTGEKVEWAKVRPAGEPQTISLRYATGGRPAIATAYRRGELSPGVLGELAGGER